MNTRRAVLGGILVTTLALGAVLGFTWNSQAERIATLFSALAGIAAIGVTIAVSPRNERKRSAPEDDRLVSSEPIGARSAEVYAAMSPGPASKPRERVAGRFRFVAPVFAAALLVGAALGAADLSWGPLAAIGTYRTAWYNLGVLALATVAVIALTRPPSSRLVMATLFVTGCLYLIIMSRHLTQEYDNPRAWALHPATTGWPLYVLVLLLALTWLALREAPPISLWTAMIAPALVYPLGVIMKAIHTAVHTVMRNLHGYSADYAMLLLNSTTIAAAVAATWWVNTRLYSTSSGK